MNMLLPAEAVQPQARWIYRAMIDIGPVVAMGAGRDGERRRVDILGGTFEGPQLKGRVLAGGQDRQLVARDGMKWLEAVYEMQTDDGAMLSVFNRVTIDESLEGPRYARSVISIQAPCGPYEWLSRRVLIGTLKSLRPERNVVCIDAYVVE
ncbi:DUF3237 domain-containing protein [soil metagenome]